ncbi:MAG: hypothetical protein ACK5L8_02485 [Marinicella pacifica]
MSFHKNNKFLLILMLAINGCNYKKIDKPYNKEFSYTELPVSSSSPALIENENGFTSEINFLAHENEKFILYNHRVSFDQDGSVIKYVKLNSLEPLEYSESKSLKPNSKYKERHISSIVLFENKTWIYYVEGDSLRDQAKSYRALWHDGSLINVEPLNINKKLVVRSWQRFFSHNNKVYMVHTGGGMFFSVSEDGINFDSFKKVYGFSAQPRISVIDNKIIIGFQKGNWQEGIMKSMVSITEDYGNNWSQPKVITDKHKNVHDSYIHTREDGNVDIYYVHPIEGWNGFSLFRRCLTSNMEWGDPELLIDKEIGNVLSPNVSRVNKVKNVVLFVEQVSGYKPYAQVINGDASCE